MIPVQSKVTLPLLTVSVLEVIETKQILFIKKKVSYYVCISGKKQFVLLTITAKVLHLNYLLAFDLKVKTVK